MLGIIISLIGGLVLGYGIRIILSEFQEKNLFYGFKMIRNARKKGRRVYLLETKNAFWINEEKESFQNIGITNSKDLIIMAPNSIKPVYGLGGVQLGVGDLYRASTIPQELRQTIVFLKIIGLKDKDISEYLSIIHGKSTDIEGETPEERAEKFLELKIDELIKETNDKKKKELLKMLKEKKEFYLTTPSTIVEYLQTGMNRVTFKMQVKQILDEKLLEKIGKRDWLSIAIAIFIILLGIWFVTSGGLGGIIKAFTGQHAIPAR